MSTATRRMRKTITRDLNGDPAEFSISADVGKPATTGDPNVYPIPDAGISSDSGEVDEQWQIKTRISGTNPETALVNYRLWLYDSLVEQWHCSVWLKAPGDDQVTDVLCQIQDLPGVLGSTFVGVEVDGLTGDHVLNITHSRR